MKRGFLLRAGKKEAAEKRDRELQTSQVVPQSSTKIQLPIRREGMYRCYDDILATDHGLDLPPECRLAYGDLSEQEKGSGTRFCFIFQSLTDSALRQPYLRTTTRTKRIVTSYHEIPKERMSLQEKH